MSWYYVVKIYNNRLVVSTGWLSEARKIAEKKSLKNKDNLYGIFREFEHYRNGKNIKER